MRLEELDFEPRRGAGAGGWLLLAAGALCLAAAVSAQLSASADLEGLKSRLAALGEERRALRIPVANPAELAAARRVVAALNRPWSALFGELEGADTADVALLALRPDTAAGELRISAEARDLGAMLAFHRWLEERPQIGDVALIRHELTPQGVGPALRFELRAGWKP